MANRIQLRRDIADNWYNVNPLLSQGEPGLETDTTKLKYGDGSTYWRDLPYASLASAYDQNLNTTDTPTFAGVDVTDTIASTSGSMNFASTDNQFYFVQGEGAGVEVHASTLVSNEIYPATDNTFNINGNLRVGGENVIHGATGTVFLRQLSLSDADPMDTTPFTITFSSQDNPDGILTFSNTDIDLAEVSTTTWTFNQSVNIGGSTLTTVDQEGRQSLEFISPGNRFIFGNNGGEGTIVEITNALEVVSIGPYGAGGESNPATPLPIRSTQVSFGTLQDDKRLDGTVYLNTIAFDTNPAIVSAGHSITYDPTDLGSLDFYTYNSDLTTFKISSITSATQVWYKPNGDITVKIDQDGLTASGNHYPTTLGTSGQVLSTDGAGNLSWVNQSGGGGGSTGDITFSASTLTSTTNDPISLHTQSGTINIDNWGYPTNSMRLANATDGESIMLQANGDGAQAKLRWHQTPSGETYRSIYSEVRSIATGVEIHNSDWTDTPNYDYKWSFNLDGSTTNPDGIVKNSFKLISTNTNADIVISQYSTDSFDSSQHHVKIRDNMKLHAATVDIINNGQDSWRVVSAVNTNLGELGTFSATIVDSILSLIFTPDPTPNSLSVISENTQFPVIGTIIPPLSWTPVLTGTALMIQDPNDPRIFTAPGDVNFNWDTQVYSQEGYSTCYVEFKWISGPCMVGLDSNPSEDASWNLIEVKWYVGNDGLRAYTWDQAGDPIYRADFTTNSIFRVEFDGTNIRYYIDGILYEERAALNSDAHYLDSSFAGYTPGIQVINFGPL